MTTTIFLISGRDVEAKRQRIILALQDVGFSLNLNADLDADPSCPCIALWSRIDATDAFGLKTELAKAANDGRLISVLLDASMVPTDLASHPIVDLSKWRGSRDNPAFIELIGKLKVAAQECAPKTATAKAARRLRLLTKGLKVAAVLGLAYTAVTLFLSNQNTVCSITRLQPNLSDMCGAMGLGGKPEREERLAWEGRPSGSCQALRDHIQRFPNGALRSAAADLINGRHILAESSWIADEQRLPVVVPMGDGFSERTLAEADAWDRSMRQATMLCEGFAATDTYRLVAAALTPDSFSCDFTASGHYCGFDGAVACALERQQTTTRELCGEVP